MEDQPRLCCAVAPLIRLLSAPKQPQRAAGVIFHTHSRDGTSLSPRWLKRRDRVSHVRAVFNSWMDSFLAVEEKALAGPGTGTSVSYFCRSHTPPTLPLLTRISQIGCDSPALAAEAEFCYSLTMSVELFPRFFFFFFFLLGVSRSERLSLMCAGLLESSLLYCQNKAPHTQRSPPNTA